jgi:hypothetical protein
MRWMGHRAHVGEMRNGENILVGKPEGKRLLEDPGVGRRVILTNLKEIQCENVNWIHLVPVVGSCEHSYKTSGSM